MICSATKALLIAILSLSLFSLPALANSVPSDQELEDMAKKFEDANKFMEQMEGKLTPILEHSARLADMISQVIDQNESADTIDSLIAAAMNGDDGLEALGKAIKFTPEQKSAINKDLTQNLTLFDSFLTELIATTPSATCHSQVQKLQGQLQEVTPYFDDFKQLDVTHNEQRGEAYIQLMSFTGLELLIGQSGLVLFSCSMA
ncbi:hypothetical protein DU002_03105 [Corallincola holothuriorum]|uniref:Uncharacterized protein n=1 Tax=Corallincola holothuriorum TaxID=2282215 RepID=A0A368NM48_9GAMM|nr:hypothetical protein [Corallincola holothuriorum]RCU51478.1 hypothetical protein DU002_03105 [Corallincola holothuriorum]